MASKDIEAGRAYVLIAIRDRMTQGLKLAEKRLQRFGRYVGTSGAVMSATGIGTLAWPLKLSADMERAQVSFETFLGSASAAKQMLNDIEMMAATTPFQFDELRDAAQLLLNFGVAGSNVLPTLRALGDVAGGDSERFSRLALAYGQVMAKGRLMGQEANQMREQGFDPLSEIARVTGRSVRSLTEAMEDGAISAAMVTQAFVTATGPGGRFHNLMQKQSHTLYGLASTMMDFGKMIARALGDTLVPTFKTAAKYLIAASTGVLTFIKNNQQLVATIGKVILVVTAVGVIMTSIGVAAAAASFVVGLMASGLAAVFSVASLLLSPFGLLLGLLGVLAVVAYRFRSQLYDALQTGLRAIWPLIAGFLQVWQVARTAIEGIVAAMMSGRMEMASRIAWLGVVAIAWTAAAQLEKAIVWVLNAIGRWIPGMNSIKQYWGDTVESIGQAILAGRWDLAGQMVMLRLKKEMLSIWQSMDGFWVELLKGFRTAWSNAITSISDQFIGWAGWMQGMSDADIKAWKDMNNQIGKEANAKIANSPAADARNAAYAASQAAMDKQIQDLDAQIDVAHKQVGSPTLEGKAEDAKLELGKAVADAKSELNKLTASGEKMPQLGQMSLNANQSLGKVESRGTFSAAAAALFGGGHDAAETTAKNTSTMVRLMTSSAAIRPIFGP